MTSPSSLPKKGGSWSGRLLKSDLCIAWQLHQCQHWLLNLKKIYNIQALRGVAILLVVFFHLSNVEKRYGGSNLILPDFMQFGMSGVDLFFVISGFVMVTVTRGKFQDFIPIIKFIYRRVSRIYPLFWFYSVAVMMFFLIQPSWFDSRHFDQVNIFDSFFLIPQVEANILLVSWSLIHEIYFYVVFSLILVAFSERAFIFSLFLWAMGVVAADLYLESFTPLLRLVSHPLTCEFIAGCMVGRIYYRYKTKVKISRAGWSYISAVSFFMLPFGYLLYRDLTGIEVPSSWSRVALFGGPSALLLCSLAFAETNGRLLPRWLILVGDASYSVYLSHLLVFKALGMLWAVFAREGIIDNVVALPSMLLAVLIFGFLSFSLIEKNLLRLSRRIA